MCCNKMYACHIVLQTFLLTLYFYFKTETAKLFSTRFRITDLDINMKGLEITAVRYNIYEGGRPCHPFPAILDGVQNTVVLFSMKT